MKAHSHALKTWEQRHLRQSVGTGVALYALVLIFGFWWFRKLPPPPVENPTNPLLEAQILDQLPPAHLHEKTASPKAAAAPEKSINTKNLGSDSSHLQQVFDAKNQTSAVPVAPDSPWPVVEYSPAPKIPDYLKNQNFKSSIAIEFEVLADGKLIPHLLSSSGSEELDALALTTVKSWRIRPAVKAGQPINSRLRLRINFEVN